MYASAYDLNADGQRSERFGLRHFGIYEQVPPGAIRNAKNAQINRSERRGASSESAAKQELAVETLAVHHLFFVFFALQLNSYLHPKYATKTKART